MLGVTVKYLDATATWRLGFGHPCCRHTRDMENNRFCQFILHVFCLNILAKYKWIHSYNSSIRRSLSWC